MCGWTAFSLFSAKFELFDRAFSPTAPAGCGGKTPTVVSEALEALALRGKELWTKASKTEF